MAPVFTPAKQEEKSGKLKKGSIARPAREPVVSIASHSFEQAFKNIDDVLWKEAGCTIELDYTEQTSWLLFLKYLDGLEQDKADEAALDGKKYTYILDKPYRWESWAAPKTADGKLDHNTAMVGDDLRDFVNQKLFPYLHGFTQRASGPNTIEYKIGEIFGEIKNKIQSGYNLRETVEHIDELRFRSQQEKHELSHLYEAKIRYMGNAGRNGGGYYRIADKTITAQSGDLLPSIVASTHTNSVYAFSGIALLVRKLIDNGKVEDPNQIALPFSERRHRAYWRINV